MCVGSVVVSLVVFGPWANFSFFLRKRVQHNSPSILCAGLDSNQRSPKAMDLQSISFDHSDTDALSHCIKLRAL